MSASQPGTSSSTQIADNRIFLFRLQILIIDGGLTSLRNYVDQELAAQSSTLSTCLAYEKARIKLLKGKKIITQVQYDLLYPSSGTVSTSDLDITLIICLVRNLKFFRLNSKFNWNIPPVQSDTSIEADICRLKLFRNEICHISTTTGIQHNDFINKWQEIEQV
ncbi:E3 ubiquitin-protein ligase DZIP3-like [Ruditapes philippinarum]|uniref:E3 ubiquitin-protein ligase DZIP3-like n=1 Tax=Ruditapes philippinarum TaxID=129788 RepID=UPI00295AB622|nr:E3 ubiquitin-protein ligase DZIP3-like [Ruditapes philippinarum]